MLLKRLMKRKLLFISLLIAITLITVFLGAKFYLLINFLSGNDTVIKVSSDKEYLFLRHGQQGEISLEAKVTTNPFCSASCNVKLLDLEKMDLIDSDDFSLKPGNPFKKSYIILADKLGSGKKFYRFDVECTSAGGLLCHSDREPTIRNLLITSEYGLNEVEGENKKEFEEKARSLVKEINEIEHELSLLKDAVNKLNQTVVAEYDFEFDLEDLLYDIKVLAISEYYYTELDSLAESEMSFSNVKEKVPDINISVSQDVSVYNSLIEDLEFSESKLSNLTNLTFPIGDAIRINLFIGEFNSVAKAFEERDHLENKSFLVKFFRDRLEKSVFLEEENGTKVDAVIEKIKFQKIEFMNIPPDEIKIEFADIIKKCTINNVTSQCSDGENPVVFLHGHSVTKDAPLEYSLEGFGFLQKKLDEEGYINAGAITLYAGKNVPAGIWNVHTPLSIRASYYFDFFEEPENYRVVLAKSENIDTYAVRLKEVFDNIRYRTGRDKINVIAFSMGGLVIRRHMQLFGSEGFDKVILIGVPNKGISGDVSTLCPLIGGEKRECEDMNSNSLFMQKLNRDELPDNIYNIYGTGCEMAEGIGDGIVLEEKAKLDIEKNFVINGICRGKFQPLHLDLLKIDMYPEIYETIKNILEEKSV
ncbi:hypothetical protein HYV89_00915 [Candidatus Woesearchaeota archaeon]|nr:hypothetical protein [Candidatus Woesearchaeota archaeon]